MAIEHKDIAEANLHEPKGASVASTGTVYTSDGAGSGGWQLPQIEGQASAAVNKTPVSDGAGGVTWIGAAIQTTPFLEVSSFADQNPTGLDTPLLINFGAGITTPEVTVDSSGNITFNTDGHYLLFFEAAFGRTTSAGTAFLSARPTVDGVQASVTATFKLPNQDVTIPYTNFIPVNATAGQVAKVWIARDSAGIDNGGLVAQPSNITGWGDSPSATLRLFLMEHIA